MYAVSEEFKTAIKSPNRQSRVYGSITTSNGIQYPIDDSNIIKDSLYITNQIVNSSKLCFGSTYAGECGMVLKSNIDRYRLFNAKIELFFSLFLENRTVETIPLGVFFVDTPERIGAKIKLTAIDAMTKFDIEVTEDTNGTLYELLAYICEKCGVELAQTQAEIEALHINATNQIYTIMQDRVSTYRDALAYLSMIVCSNATIDRNGRLKLVQYAVTNCDSNDSSTRFNNCKISDYTTRFSCVKARFIAQENYSTYSSSDEESDGLIFDFGDIPIVGGTPETKQATIDAMLETVKQIEYVPTTLYISPNPAYELGDMIKCEGVNNSTDDVNTYIMQYRYDYRKKETITCYGENPLLQNVKGEKDRLATEIENQLSKKDIVVVSYDNAKQYKIKQQLVDIITLNYSVFADCRPIVICTIPFSLDVDGYVEFSIYNGLVAIDGAVYRGYYLAGEHFATFMYLDDMKANERKSLRVLCKCYADTASFARTLEARINALEGGTATANITEPTAIIEPLTIKAIAYTQGINSDDVNDWDGTLEFVDNYSAIQLINDMVVNSFNAKVNIAQQEPTSSIIRENFRAIQLINDMIVSSFNAELGRSLVIFGDTFDTENGSYSKYVSADGVYKLQRYYWHTSEERSIDSGKMCAIEINTSNFASVESVVITDG